MFSLFLEFFHWLPAYFFPKTCFDCGAEGAYVCSDCLPKVRCLIRPMRLICPICHMLSYGGWTHKQCQTRYGLDRLISFYEYDGWAKKIIKNVKFKKNKIYRALTDLSAEFALALKGDSLLGKVSPYKVSVGSSINDSRLTISGAVLVPVPLHWYRQLKRGLNQSSLIAKALSRGLNIPVNEKLLKRVRHTDPQTLVSSSLREKFTLRSKATNGWQSSKALRFKNISGAFVCNSRIRDEFAKTGCPFEIKNTLFILVDDVWTTGITLTECCRVLKKAGAKKVWALTLLRA